jgi:hypothetical protein
MFSQVLEKIDTWLGRSFLVARFFPWVMFAAANLGLACVEYPVVWAFVQEEYKHIGTAERAVDILVALGAIAVVAYTVSPALQWITGLLEGRGLSTFISEPLLLRRRLERDRYTARAQKLFRSRAALPETGEVVSRLGDALNAGARHRTITDIPLIRKAEAELRRLRRRRLLNRPISATELNLAIQAFKQALLRNCAKQTELKPPVHTRTYRYSRRLHGAYRELTQVIVPYAIDVAETREAHDFEIDQKLFAKTELAPTRLGNDVAALRSYCAGRYGFDFDFFWPRLQLVLGDDKLVTKLTASQIQVEFSILSLCLSVILTVVWLVILGFFGARLLTLLIVALAGPALITIWLWMVHESFSAYAALVRGVIDISRFDLLKALRRPLPESTTEEKAVWEKTARFLMLGEEDEGAQLKQTWP